MCISINAIRLSQVVTQNHWYRNCRKRYFNMLTHTHCSASEYCYSLAYVSNQPNEVLITFFPLLIIDGLKVGFAWMASVIISITGTDSHGHMQLMAIANGTLGGIASSVSFSMLQLIYKSIDPYLSLPFCSSPYITPNVIVNIENSRNRCVAGI